MNPKAQQVQEILNKYVPEPVIPLIHTNPFTLLIAVVLSAQCTDERVNQVTETLFSLATTPQQLLAISLEKLEDIIRPCGLFRTKARALHEISSTLIKQFNSRVPQTFTALESLQGVGHKTASVVLSHAFGIEAFPVDTHIFRVAHRWNLSTKKTVKGVEEDLKRLFPSQHWLKLHLQMILFARQYCRAKAHRIESCPICSTL